MYIRIPSASMTERELWLKRAERWRDTDLTIAEYAAEIGCDSGLLRKAIERPHKLPGAIKEHRKRADRPRRDWGGQPSHATIVARMAADHEWTSRHKPFPTAKEQPYSLWIRRRWTWKRMMANVRRVEFSTREPFGLTAQPVDDVRASVSAVEVMDDGGHARP